MVRQDQTPRAVPQQLGHAQNRRAWMGLIRGGEGPRHLQVALGLHEAAHDAKCRVQPLPIRVHGRGCRGDDGVVRPLVGRQAIWVVRIQDEVGAPVLRLGIWLVCMSSVIGRLERKTKKPDRA